MTRLVDYIAVTGSQAQTITGVKTFSAANVHSGAETHSGVETHSGEEVFSTMFKIPVNASVAGAGTVQGDAAALSTGFTVITGANGTLGWGLPAAAAGKVVIIKGTTSGVAKIWPATGDAINALGANNVMSLASGVVPAIFVAADATTWYTLPLLPS